MRKNRFLTLTLAVIMLLSILTLPTDADADWAKFLNFDPVSEAMPKGNILKNGSFDDKNSISEWECGSQKLTHVAKSNGGYLRMSDIPHPTLAFDWRQEAPAMAGIYKFTGYFRMAYKGEVTELRLFLYDRSHDFDMQGTSLVYVYPTHDEWLKVEFYAVFESEFIGIRVAGGDRPEFVQSYCIDNFSLVKVDSIPDGYTAPTSFGKKVTYQQAKNSNNGSVKGYPPFDPELEAQYDVQGIVYNRDIDFIGTCSAHTTREDIEKYVYGYRDTNVTDFMINVFCQIATYPSDVASDFMDKYHYYREQGRAVPDNRAVVAHALFEEKGLDYISIFCEKFPEIGINPWISLRMNDAHGVSSPQSVVAWKFFQENPHLRRVKHGATTNTYYDNLFDYSYSEVREYMLALINEVLDRYDAYGIELDYQRDIWIWHTGGEYPGIEILNDFMRDVKKLVGIYEEKYGHEIKIAVRCSSDIQTNYELGYDLITWAAEDLMDLVNPTARWATTDFDIPVRSWVSIMHPFGVEVAPGLEGIVRLTPQSLEKHHSFDTMSGAAASWLSQGADKIYMYNHFAGLPGIQDKDRVIGGTNHFNKLITMGCYEKVVNHDRQVLITYNDIAPTWRGVKASFPFTVPADSAESIRIPMGDIPEGARVILRISAPKKYIDAPITVRVNGVQVERFGTMNIPDAFTKDKCMLFLVPESAHDDMYLVVEVESEMKFMSNYIDLYISTQK